MISKSLKLIKQVIIIINLAGLSGFIPQQAETGLFPFTYGLAKGTVYAAGKVVRGTAGYFLGSAEDKPGKHAHNHGSLTPSRDNNDLNNDSIKKSEERGEKKGGKSKTTTTHDLYKKTSKVTEKPHVGSAIPSVKTDENQKKSSISTVTIQPFRKTASPRSYYRHS